MKFLILLGLFALASASPLYPGIIKTVLPGVRAPEPCNQPLVQVVEERIPEVVEPLPEILADEPQVLAPADAPETFVWDLTNRFSGLRRVVRPLSRFVSEVRVPETVVETFPPQITKIPERIVESTGAIFSGVKPLPEVRVDEPCNDPTPVIAPHLETPNNLPIFPVRPRPIVGGLGLGGLGLGGLGLGGLGLGGLGSPLLYPGLGGLTYPYVPSLGGIVHDEPRPLPPVVVDSRVPCLDNVKPVQVLVETRDPCLDRVEPLPALPVIPEVVEPIFKEPEPVFEPLPEPLPVREPEPIKEPLPLIPDFPVATHADPCLPVQEPPTPLPPVVRVPCEDRLPTPPPSVFPCEENPKYY